MEVKVLWSDTALGQLEDIYSYYKEKASPTVARKIVKKLIDKSLILESNPLVGVLEPLLMGRVYGKEYRFLVEKNYKIIYCFNANLVEVMAVFDTRQNPEKLKELTD